MSFNRQDLSEQTSNSQTRGNGTSNNGQPVLDASQDSSIQNSNTQTPTTKQPPTLPSITATCGVPSHPDPFNFGLHYPLNGNDIQASRNGPHTHAHFNGGHWIPSNNNAAPPNWSHSPSSPFGHNPNYPWNNNSVPAPPNPHPAVASTAHLPAAGYLPSTFTPGPVSARSQELMNDSTPLEPSGQQPRMPNPLGPVGVYGPAYRQWLIQQFEDCSARRQARLSTAQTDMSQRRRSNSTGSIVVTELTFHSEILASLAEVAIGMNEESDSPAGPEIPDSDDEAELYDSSLHGDANEQDPNAATEAASSEEALTNGPNPEGGSGASM
ncbi:hypothetical protein JMJ35_006952 [Cladonia borealis]|uniref:Uncharacterized protein n=1 Tax=Cladonia borealis TaxID=184061 RepID=A0AA39QWK4_9LECA|nr:hypothetical protein JMJ35_006952 [Cladonia borealis]